MMAKATIIALVGLAISGGATTLSRVKYPPSHEGHDNGHKNHDIAHKNLCLAPNALQTASEHTGFDSSNPGTTPSATCVNDVCFYDCNEATKLPLLLRDSANFINFCKNHILTDGQQIVGGSCNGIGRSLAPVFVYWRFCG